MFEKYLSWWWFSPEILGTWVGEAQGSEVEGQPGQLNKKF